MATYTRRPASDLARVGSRRLDDIGSSRNNEWQAAARKRAKRDSEENPESPVEAEAKLVDGGPIGVGGRSLHAYRGTPGQLSGTEIERPLRRWQAGHAEFPFSAVVAHYQAVGRNSVQPNVAAMLRDVARQVP